MQSMLLAAGLLRAATVFEEWSLVDEAPLREVVVLRAHYESSTERDALLPSPITQSVSLSIWDASTGARLASRCTAAGCVVRLPSGGSRRVVARFERDATSPRAFALSWPPRGTAGARRVIALPRGWAATPPEGWRCPGLDVDELVCVDDGTAAPFSLRAPARRSTRAQWLGALGTSLAALVAAGRLGRDAIEARLAALGGGAVAVACALTVVGARLVPWALALTALVPVAELLGALATRRRASRIVAAAGLAVIPLIVVSGATTSVALGVSGAWALAILAAVSTPEPSR